MGGSGANGLTLQYNNLQYNRELGNLLYMRSYTRIRERLSILKLCFFEQVGVNP